MRVKMTLTDGRVLSYEFEDSIVETQLVLNIERGMVKACDTVGMPWLCGYFDLCTAPTISDEEFDRCINQANELDANDGGGPEPSQRVADSIDGYDRDDLGDSPDY